MGALQKKVPAKAAAPAPYLGPDVTARFDALDWMMPHVATGADLDYQTPFGHLRAGVGVRLNRLEAPNPDPGERLAIHLALGESF